MNLTALSCIYLFSCLSPEKTFTDECPEFCECQSALKDGHGNEPAFSFRFTNVTGNNLENFEILNKKLKWINTLMLDEVDDEQLDLFKHVNSETERSGFSINNLVLNRISNNDNTTFTKSQIIQLLRLVNPDHLQVLTVLDVNQTESLSIMFLMEMIKTFPRLKAIHVQGGELTTLDYMWCEPGNIASSLHSLTLDDIGLKHLNLECLSFHRKFRMLTVTRNQISRLELSKSDTLWYLDLRNNKLEHIPEELPWLFKSLRVLKIGGNNIHTINMIQIKALIKINEMDFFGMQDMENESYFDVNYENIWIYYLLREPNKLCDQGNCSLPFFFRNSIAKAKCKVHDQADLLECRDVPFEQFNIEQPVATSKLPTSILLSKTTDKITRYDPSTEPDPTSNAYEDSTSDTDDSLLNTILG